MQTPLCPCFRLLCDFYYFVQEILEFSAQLQAGNVGAWVCFVCAWEGFDEIS